MLDEFVDDLLERHFENAEADLIKEEIMFKLLVDVKIEPEEFEKLGKEGLKEKLLKLLNRKTSSMRLSDLI